MPQVFSVGAVHLCFLCCHWKFWSKTWFLQLILFQYSTELFLGQFSYLEMGTWPSVQLWSLGHNSHCTNGSLWCWLCSCNNLCSGYTCHGQESFQQNILILIFQLVLQSPAPKRHIEMFSHPIHTEYLVLLICKQLHLVCLTLF